MRRGYFVGRERRDDDGETQGMITRKNVTIMIFLPLVRVR